MKKDLIFTGAGTALVTPFTSAGEIAWEELDRLVEFQLENKIDAIIACGTTGEAATMTGEEHLEVIDFYHQEGGGPGACHRRHRQQRHRFLRRAVPGGQRAGGRRPAAGHPLLQTRPLRRAWWRASTSSPTR